MEKMYVKMFKLCEKCVNTKIIIKMLLIVKVNFLLFQVIKMQ